MNQQPPPQQQQGVVERELNGCKRVVGCFGILIILFVVFVFVTEL